MEWRQGERWLPAAVSFLVLCVLSWYLAGRLLEMEGLSERLLVDATLRNIQTGLYIAQGEAATTGHRRQTEDWLGENPIVWLATPPAGYVGLCPPENRHLGAGVWCFDAVTAELAYRPHHVGLYHPLSGDLAARGLRWKVIAEGPGKALRVKLITPFVWKGG